MISDLFGKRINIFIGAFGSGKSEIAVNYAQKLNEEGNKTALVDMDIVNPFFRSADAENEMVSLGIKVIKPIYANTNIDVPALPPDINSVIDNKSYTVVFDVGGDDLGARAISAYKNQLEQEDYSMFFVVNTMRPFTTNASNINEMLLTIQTATRLKVTHIVNNTNLLDSTIASDIIESNYIIKKVALENNIEFGFICAIPDIAKELMLATDDKILILSEYIKLPWNKA